MAKWITAKEGIRYREHATRKHGVGVDRYYAIRYRDLDGIRREEALGWASQGWTVKKVQDELARLRANRRTGTGPQSLQESRAAVKAKHRAAEAAAAETARLNKTFAEVFESYLEYSKQKKQSEQSWKREEQLFRLHISPVIGKLTLQKIAPFTLDRLKSNMDKAGQSPRSIRYALAVVRQVINYAIREDIYTGKNPAAGKTVERPQADNRKDRYLTREEADLLLNELGKRSPDIHDMSMLSLYTGMRFGEIANLRWGNVDLLAGKIMLRKTKSKKDRPAYLTPAVKTMLARRGQGAADDLVFPARHSAKNPDGNNPRTMVSTLFYKVVAELFNKGISDRKQWVNFHTLRHTFASWLVESDVNIWIVKDLLGHSDLKVTERYAHVGANQLQAAVLKLQQG